MSRFDMPFESPRKYGVFDDNLDDLDDVLAGRDPKRRPAGGGDSVSGDDSEVVDAAFLQKAVSERKYGD
jgi:hypothetical protein